MTLTNIVNAVFRLSYFPSEWKLATIFPLLKPQKNPALPVSYRPISLLPSLGKVVEKLIHCRLSRVVNKLKLIPSEQFGFQRGHSTQHQIYRLVDDIKTAMTNRQATSFLLIDSEKAFDSVWIYGLIHKLINFKLPMAFCRLLYSFLTKRTIQARVGSVTSQVAGIPAGVPQGSILSPILNNLYTADLYDVLHPHVKIVG